MSENSIVIVGLGNPGRKYEMTRHNLGAIIVQAFARELGLSLKEDKKLQASFATGQWNGVKVHLVLPTTYMNNSGVAVQKYLNYFKLRPDSLLVLTDDVALPFEEMRIRKEGSAGGHNGLKSLIQHLGTMQFRRLRLGVGRGKPQQELADFVLEPFAAGELESLKHFITRGVKVVKRLVTEDIDLVMNEVNQKVKEDNSDGRNTESL